MNNVIIDVSKLFDTLSKRVDELSKRVDSVEELDWKYWLPLVITLITVIVGWVQGYISKRKNRLAIIQESIEDARIRYSSISIQVGDGVISPIVAKAEDFALDELFRKYNNGCDKFFENKLPQKEFRKLHHKDIVDYMNKFPNKFNGDMSDYYSMKRYYKKYHQQIS